MNAGASGEEGHLGIELEDVDDFDSFGLVLRFDPSAMQYSSWTQDPEFEASVDIFNLVDAHGPKLVLIVRNAAFPFSTTKTPSSSRGASGFGASPGGRHEGDAREHARLQCATRVGHSFERSRTDFRWECRQIAAEDLDQFPRPGVRGWIV